MARILGGECSLHVYGGTDGAFGGQPVFFDFAGNLYGTTSYGGNTAPCSLGDDTNAGCGVVFKLRPTVRGPWTESVLYAFTGATDGGLPGANLVFDSAGNIFGTTEGGGNTSECTGNVEGEPGCGVVFRIDQRRGERFDLPELHGFTLGKLTILAHSQSLQGVWGGADHCGLFHPALFTFCYHLAYLENSRNF